jgi:hypothetical protein
MRSAADGAFGMRAAKRFGRLKNTTTVGVSHSAKPGSRRFVSIPCRICTELLKCLRLEKLTPAPPAMLTSVFLFLRGSC